MSQSPQWSVPAGEAAYGWVASETYPSYGYMLANGATTTLEHWDTPEEHDSWNHAWLNSVLEFMHSYIVGIRLPVDAVGADRVIVGPMPFGWRVLGNESWGFAPGQRPDPLTHAASTRLLPTGQVSVDWSIRVNGSSLPLLPAEARVQAARSHKNHSPARALLGRDGFTQLDLDQGTRAAGDLPLVFEMDVSLPGNLRTTVKVPVCKAEGRAVRAACDAHVPAPTFVNEPAPAVQFELVGATSCSFAVDWVC